MAVKKSKGNGVIYSHTHIRKYNDAILFGANKAGKTLPPDYRPGIDLPEEWDRNMTILNCPQQKNGDDCGAFVCQGAKFIVFKESIENLNQAWVDLCREQMMDEIWYDKIDNSMGTGYY